MGSDVSTYMGPNRAVTDQDGDFHLNGAAFYNNDGNNIASQLNTISADVIISSAEILALNATPQTLVAAPGAGIYRQFLGAYILLDHAGTDYAGIAAGEDLAIKYTNASGAIISTIEATGFMDASADAVMIATPDDVVAVANAAIVLHMLVGEIITGDSPLKIRTFYRDFTVASLEAIA